MRLYAQTILIIVLTVIAVSSILLITFELTVMGSYSTLEGEYRTQDLLRAENAIASEIQRVSAIAQDWADWDESYTYVQGANPSFPDLNLAPSTLLSLNISALAIYDLNKSLINGLAVNNSFRKVSPISPDLDSIFRNSILDIRNKGISGILPGYSNPIIFASYPILTSKKEGPSQGVLVIANILDESRVRVISLDILRNVSFIPIQWKNQNKPGNHSITPSDLLNTGNDGTVLKDYNGYPAYLLKIHESGDLSRSAVYYRLFFLASLLLLIILFMCLASWLLNRVIITPLQILNLDLLRIGESGSLSGRISGDRHDEIGDLTTSINSMLASLEEAHRERLTLEQRLTRIIELVEEGICLIGPDGLIWFANPTMASIFDTTAHDLTGVAIHSLLLPEILHSQNEEEEECSEDQISCLTTGQREYHNRTREGREIWIRVATAPYPLDTGKMGHLCVITDITPFRTAERELRLSNKKLDLLGSMTRHDIVNQLTTIRGMLGLIKRKNTDHSLDQLIASADDASDRINKHIEFSKEYQKAGIEEPRWQEIRTIWNLAYAMSRRRGLTFTINGDNFEIYADQLLQKVFYNLIDNSTRHGKDVFYITITIKQEESDLLILYEDDGGGIVDTMKSKIFDRGVGTGTGWGLFFVHEVLNLTGISIQESGTYGIGVLFTIRVPEGIYRPSSRSNHKESENPSQSDPNPESNPGNQEHHY